MNNTPSPFVSCPSAGLPPLRMNLAKGQVETPISRAELRGISNPEHVEGLDANGFREFYS